MRSPFENPDQLLRLAVALMAIGLLAVVGDHLAAQVRKSL